MIEIKRKGQAAAEIPVERAQMTADGLEARMMEGHTHGTQTALKREIRPFTGIDENRDYRAMYKAAFEYHSRHNPPRIDRDYWQTHTPGVDSVPQAEVEYWERAAQDGCEICNSFDNDRFLTDLLLTIYNELGREYKAQQQAARVC